MQKSSLINLVASVSISALATGVAISAQDKYSLQVPMVSRSPSSGDTRTGP
ncbi:hypothetical protein [Bradyrhizobium sp. 8-10B]|uniref:hypothetical protein n=1 Tax=Bradyrhizobium sp. 8-10B TaxID=3344579 RepID=UPI0035C24036